MITCEDMGILKGEINGDFFGSVDCSKPIEVIYSKEGGLRARPFAEFC